MNTLNSKILLVDDELFQLKLLEMQLKSNGYNCKTATSVNQALNILENFIPDLIISDYDMPEVNGFVFRETVLKNKNIKDVPFVFLTSFNDNDMIQKGLDLNALDYIPKNIPPSQLIAKIKNITKAIEEQHQKSLSELRKVAEKLNLKNIPKEAPLLKSFEIQFFNQTFQNYPGGDFIDIVKINDRYTFVILGDVMGKKWGAWFFSFSFLSYIRSAIRICVFDGNLSPGAILNKINKVVYYDDFFDDIFSTLSLVLIDDEQQKITYSGAGDLPLLKYNAASDCLETYQSDGLLLGFFESGNYTEQIINLAKDDELFIVSDGMMDFEIDGKKHSNLDLLKERLLNYKRQGISAYELKNLLFDKDKTQIDDCSFIILKKKQV